KGYGDTSLGSYKAMEVSLLLIHFLEANKWYDKKIGTNSYLQRVQLTDPYVGYLKGKTTFTQVDWEVKEDTEIAIFTNIEFDYQYDKIKNDPDFELVYTCEQGIIWGKIYKRK